MADSTRVTVERHHVKWAVVVAVILIGGIAVAAYMAGGRIQYADNQITVTAPQAKFASETTTKPTAPEVKPAVTANAPAQPAVPAAAPPTVMTAAEQEAEAAKLREQIAAANKELELKRLRAELEAAQAAAKQPVIVTPPAPPSQPVQITQAAPGQAPTAPQAVAQAPAPVAPAPATQSPAPGAQAQGAQPPASPSESDVTLAARAYKTLGPAPGGQKLAGFEQTPQRSKICWNGEPAKLVKSVPAGDGGTFDRWQCPKNPNAR